MNAVLVRVAGVLALLAGTGWAAAGAPAPAALWSPSAPSAPVAAAVESTPTPQATDEFPFVDGGGQVNNVEAQNRQDGRFELDGRAQYVRDMNNDISESNLAVARATCTDCQTIALALQLVVYRQGATNVTPGNAAVAVNADCTRCLTVARAIQYVIPVADPQDVPPNVKDLSRALNGEINELERIRQLNQGNVQLVESQINDIIARFDSLRVFLHDDRREAVQSAPVATPTPLITTVAPQTTAPVITPVAPPAPLPPTATSVAAPAGTP